MDVTVDAERLRADLEANAAFGAIDAESGRGRTTLTGTAANRQARDRLVTELEDAGCTVRVDAVGNIAGRWMPPGVDPDAAPVAAGSHLDSVPRGGIFDGPLGVYAAVEAVRTLAATDIELDRPIEVISFTEEEGARFGDGLLGSSVATGTVAVEAALDQTDSDGIRLGDALAEQGYAGEGVLDASAWAHWLELHIEQSRRLERADEPVGIVSDITGIAHLSATITGTADHAGATPMSERTDALTAASEVILAIETAATDAPTETAVGTVGSVDVTPNATNVVPGAVELGIDIRDIDRDAMTTMIEAVQQALDRVEATRGVSTALETDVDLDPTPMAHSVREAIETSTDGLDLEAPTLHSGAAHDSMHVASVTDAGMVFARSAGGHSHSPREWTDWADCAIAAAVVTNTIARLAQDKG